MDLGLVYAATVTAFGAVIVAMLQRTSRRKAQSDAALQKRDAILDDIQKKLTTNGSGKQVGQLVELMYTDLQETKRDLAEHEQKTDAHGLHIWERKGQ